MLVMTDATPGCEAATSGTPCGGVTTGCVSDYVLTPVLTPLVEFRPLTVASAAAGVPPGIARPVPRAAGVNSL